MDIVDLYMKWGLTIHRRFLSDMDVEEVLQETALALCEYASPTHPLDRIFMNVRRRVVKSLLQPRTKALSLTLDPEASRIDIEVRMDLEDAVASLPPDLRREWLTYTTTDLPVDHYRVAKANRALRQKLEAYDTPLIDRLIIQTSSKRHRSNGARPMRILVLSRGYLYTVPQNAVNSEKYQVDRWNNDAIDALIKVQDKASIVILDPCNTNPKYRLMLSRELGGKGLHNITFHEGAGFPSEEFDYVYIDPRLIPDDLAVKSARKRRRRHSNKTGPGPADSATSDAETDGGVESPVEASCG